MIGEGVCNENGCLVPSSPLEGDAAAPVPDAAAALTKCTGDGAEPPAEPIRAPSLDAWRAAVQELPSQGDGSRLPEPIAPAVCTEGRWDVALPFGSAYVHVRQHESGDCEIWLGGETESPLYDGAPTQYCRFPPSCRPVVPDIDDGGPARIDSPHCVAM